MTTSLAGTEAASVPAPTPWTLERLLRHTATVAAEVRAGIHQIRFDAEHRWSTRLHSDEHMDVWLISWTPDQSTRLHDHAGSLGALTVASGTLTEVYWSGGHGERTLPTGTGAGFPLGHVHDVVNRQADPAVSVHAYSPPLTAMSYYETGRDNTLRRTHSVLTDDPEPQVTTLDHVPTVGGGALGGNRVGGGVVGP
ncbi:cysteine dioxygenase family protein [Spiractinospora alimapuensis]|uniref:cysteine dioxygenase n=1 Tax=Spiractinospora alimapuensis TaxID=2820884 RepID=UPI001F1B0C31|nr:cysteine dioxygenase family protein [Spiractinospora alimapuensis]QVQ50045.1 cysteine dioxygenase family protein [Spiractinospora alimapuensis]